jgi:hypothetical protein
MAQNNPGSGRGRQHRRKADAIRSQHRQAGGFALLGARFRAVYVGLGIGRGWMRSAIWNFWQVSSASQLVKNLIYFVFIFGFAMLRLWITLLNLAWGLKRSYSHGVQDKSAAKLIFVPPSCAPYRDGTRATSFGQHSRIPPLPGSDHAPEAA